MQNVYLQVLTRLKTKKNMEHTLKFYPVGNGDCVLASIGGANEKMMFDCNFRQKAEEDNDDMFDVANDLIENELKTKNGLPFLDAFLLTHPDKDHCGGFEDKFYLGDPDEVSDNDKKANKILIGELWYSPRIFEEFSDELSSNAKAFKKEAKRRMDLFKSDNKKANKDGNRIRIIGWADNKELEGLEARIIVPGNIINEVNAKTCKHFELFIHAPFKDDIENADRNETSIVIQLRFFTDDKKKELVRVFLGGDAEWRVWDKIMEVTKDDDYLKWDLLEAPHHCSYTFFADNRDEEPNKASLDFLDKRESNAFVISSSKVIKKNSDNPPCQKAKNRYVDRVGESNFFCTSGESDNDTEKPIMFTIENGGLSLYEDKKEATAFTQHSSSNAKPHYYG